MTDQATRKIYVVFNPTAGKEIKIDDVRAALTSHLSPTEWTLEIYQTTGKEDVPALVRAACDKGAAMVVSAGGDGTLVGVVNGVVKGKVPLGILPMGTGNDLARALGIPLKLEDAAKLLADEHEVIEVDALKVGNRYFVSNVSVGISPLMMRDTPSEEKKKFGRLAYFWTLVKHPSVFRLRRYTVTIDGEPRSVRAAEIMISNSTLLDKPPSFFGPPETLNDGQFDAYLVSAESVVDYLGVVWDMISHPGWSGSKLLHLVGKKKVRIEGASRQQLAQADGEVIGNTPIDVEMVPRAVQVIMPKPSPVPAANPVEAVKELLKTG